jgi:hypothetical protein
VQEAAVEQCRKTLEGDGSVPLIDRVKKMASLFAEYGVTREMLEERLQHRLEATSATELVSLRGVYQSLRDGMSTREDWFQVVPVPAEGESAAEALAERLAAPKDFDPADEAPDPATKAKAAELKEQLAEAPPAAAPDEDDIPLAEQLKIQFTEACELADVEGQRAVDAWQRFVKLAVGSYPAEATDEQWHALADRMNAGQYDVLQYAQ